MKSRFSSFIIFVYFLSAFVDVYPQQINIFRVEMMPSQPSPYLMRNWKEVARGYDSLVFKNNISGQYLPLIRVYDNTVNYTNHGSFGLHTVVGTVDPSSSEAINVLPELIGSSLVGINKSNQGGQNYVLMSEEFFNKRAAENVYLNHPVSTSGDDWWYETMPNIFFYQLFDLYPGTGDFNYQFVTIGDRWLEAVNKMGGSTTPWKMPDMNYRAWKLSTMAPNASGVKEPEASGAIAWILYNAYKETGEEKYRIGAEWCMEFLNSLSSNPSYELQLPYGVLTAARMNAELGTNYNVQKMISWCFDIGPLRQWGAIVGKWNGYDVSGIVGELGDNDYAFLMNTFELAGALVPLVRYDDRFARAIGKWMLNASNAARLFYSNYLPVDNQDSYEWSHQYDPNSYIGHEALRETKNGKTPFATGDAISGGWGATNLALYGSSHVGIFGGIIDTTNVEKILKLDLNKTDYYSNSAYPSYLIYNPYSEIKTVQVNTGGGGKDIYDAVSNNFIKRNASGLTEIDIPADAAVIAVITPAGGAVTYSLNKMLINGIVADFNSGQPVSNNPPRIKSLSATRYLMLKGDSLKIYCTSEDIDNDPLSFSWITDNGIINGSGSTVNYYAPQTEGEYHIICSVSDTKGGTDSDTIKIKVVSEINIAPRINSIKAKPRKIDINSVTQITCSATDADGDNLSYSWNSSAGIITGSGSFIQWNSPGVPGNYYVVCTVNDGTTEVKDSILIVVRDFSKDQTGNLLLYLPFNGNANDESGNANNTFVYQSVLTPDRFNNPNQAYFFNGTSNYIQITNTAKLNFQNAISVNFWMKVKAFYEREQYPISHGNWENRWKVSITNKKIRWTIKTNTGVKDLDSETELKLDSLYNITAVYNGSDVELYINGELDAYSSWSGSINQTTIDLILGQVLPNNNTYGFNGVLDEVRIYDYALSVNQVKSFYDLPVGVNNEKNMPENVYLSQNYPNPFNPSTKINFSIPVPGGLTTLKIYGILGNEITTLINEEKTAGSYEITFDAASYGLTSGVYFYKLITGSNQQEVKKMILIR